MDKLINLELAIKALTGWETEPTDEEIEYTLRNLATDTNVGTNEDCINRKQALAILYDFAGCIVDTPNGDYHKAYKKYHDMMEQLPPVQPEPCEDAVSRKSAIDAVTDELDMIDHVPQWVFDRLEKRLKQLPPVTPKQRTGEWILDRSGAYCCSECMEPCAGYVMMKPRDKFCKMCGAKMEGDAE